MLVLDAYAKERLVLIVYYYTSIHLPLCSGGRLRRTFNILSLRCHSSYLEQGGDGTSQNKIAHTYRFKNPTAGYAQSVCLHAIIHIK